MNYNRDLLVLIKTSQMTERAVQNELTRIHTLLHNIENYDKFSRSHELLDLNTYKIHRSKRVITDFLKKRDKKPFVFLSPLN